MWKKPLPRLKACQRNWGNFMEGDLLAARRHPLDVQARPVRRQRKGRGVLRGAQGGVPLQVRLVAREPRGVPLRARGLRRVVPRRQAEAVRGAGRDEALRDHHGPQAQAGACGVGWSKKSSAAPSNEIACYIWWNEGWVFLQSANSICERYQKQRIYLTSCELLSQFGFHARVMLASDV